MQTKDAIRFNGGIGFCRCSWGVFAHCNDRPTDACVCPGRWGDINIAARAECSEGAAAMDWTLQLSGAREATIDKAYFEQGLNCSPSHRAFWTDGDDNVWEACRFGCSWLW